MRMLCLLLVLFAGPVLADGLPSLHRVVGVAENDALNIRLEPTTNAPVIGRLDGTATGIEVVQRSADGRWGQINHEESAGWVSLRYLSVESPVVWPPQTLRCYGTEPFWSLDVTDQRAVFDRPGGPAVTHPIDGATRSLNRTDRFGLTGPTLTATVSGQNCSDGMSDRNFGLSVDLMIRATPQPMQYSGCCTLAP